jgi:hypothetical protein
VQRIDYRNCWYLRSSADVVADGIEPPTQPIQAACHNAREIPTFGSKGDPVDTCWRLLLKA